MKLFLQLSNSANEIEIVKQALRHTNITAGIDEGKIVLEFESRTQWTFDTADSTSIWGTWEEVRELINIVNGAVELEGITLERVDFTRLLYVDADGIRQDMPNNGIFYGVLPALRSTSPDVSQFILLGLNDITAAKALRLFSRDLDWITLYKIYEVIEKDLTKCRMVSNGWATKDEIKAFKGSANHPSVSGDDSRHSVLRGPTPQLQLHLADARHLIKRILRQWLHSKVPGCGG